MVTHDLLLYPGLEQSPYSSILSSESSLLYRFATLATLATAKGVHGARFHIHAPLQHLTKADIIRRGLELGLDYGLTHSCYDPDSEGRPCGRCDSCLLRAAGFAEAGVIDPVAAR